MPVSAGTLGAFATFPTGFQVLDICDLCWVERCPGTSGRAGIKASSGAGLILPSASLPSVSSRSGGIAALT